MALAVAVLALALLSAPPAAATEGFVEVASAAGLGAHVQHVKNEPASCILGPFLCAERMTGGAAVADYDGDGDPDLFVTILDGPDKLFQNQGDGSFTDVAASAGLAAFDTQSNGAAFADLDNDGDADLYVTTFGAAGDPVNDRHYLFVNQGNGTFTEEAVARGAAVASSQARLGWSVAVGDYDRDGWLDLFTGEWRPDGLALGSPTHARLLRNLGPAQPGHFADTTVAAGVDLDALVVFPEGVWAFAPAFVDLDGDGWQDLAIASDFGSSRIFWNDGDGTFTDGTAHAKVGTDENGMGSTFGDFDGDGDLDWFVTSIHDPAETCESRPCNWGYTGNRLYRYDGGRRFKDVTSTYGVRAGYWGWGAAFFDADHDADVDLVMTNGIDFPGADDDAFNHDPMRLWRNLGPASAMLEVSATEGVTDDGSGKGLVTLDYDGDGDEDVFVVNTAAAPVLYENVVAAAGDWLRVRAEGVAVNRDGIGTRVIVTPTPGGTPQTRVIGVGHHYMGAGEPVAHFGLGAAGGAIHEVRLEWPNSRVSVLPGVARNQVLTVVEPASDVCNDGHDNDGDGLVDHPADPGCASPTDLDEQSPALPCDNGIDDDGDGYTDDAVDPDRGDPGCTGPTDPSERDPGLVCDDGTDDDLDTFIDYPEDPGCSAPTASLEDPQCQDGIDNDGNPGIDFDGGASHNGGVPYAAVDPQCAGHPARDRERARGCGLGWELALLLGALGVAFGRLGGPAPPG